MRISTLLAVSLITWPLIIPVNGQSGKQDKPIHITTALVRVDSLLHIISRETGFKFSYNPKLINYKASLKVSSHYLSANKWLDILDQQLMIDHKVMGEHIILTGTKNIVSITGVKKITSKPYKNKTILQNTRFGTPVIEELTTAMNVQPDKVTSQSDNKTISLKLIPVIPNMANKDDINNTPGKISTSNISIKNPGDTIPLYADNQKNRKLRFPVQNIKKLEVGIQGIGIAWERKISNFFTLDISTGIGGKYIITSRLKYNIGIYERGAYLSLNPRWYYHGITGKNKANDGGYFGLEFKYVHDLTKVDFQGSVFLINLHYGIQKKLSDRWMINVHAGPGFGRAVRSDSLPYKKLYPSLDLKISYLLRSKRK